MLPAMKITEPYSPTARAKASAKPVSSAGSRIGKTTRLKVCQRLRAQAGGGLLELGVEILQHRLDRAHDEGQADEVPGEGREVPVQQEKGGQALLAVEGHRVPPSTPP